MVELFEYSLERTRSRFERGFNGEVAGEVLIERVFAFVPLTKSVRERQRRPSPFLRNATRILD